MIREHTSPRSRAFSFFRRARRWVWASRDETYTVTADVEQAPNLFKGGRVTVRGIEVGEITERRAKVDRVTLTLEVDHR